jgi:hypothetical protein
LTVQAPSLYTRQRFQSSMSYKKQFDRILERLYERRTAVLTRLLVPGKGPSRRLTKKHRDRRIRDLQEVASAALARNLAKRHFNRAVTERCTWRSKGWGRETKRKIFRSWIRRKIHKKRGKVYVFWRGKECRYVGRTTGGGTRPSHHFRKSWFSGTTRIDVYVTQQKRSVPSVECLAIHRFRPTKNKMRAAKRKWTPRCSLCKIHKKIRTEVRKIYRFR